ncbi:CaiB/BaiF CoA transferase family protein [Propylenella binzhouense]|uniref:CoA transferase n=1 Tax=Propylenella binzhouense TaxID=2555902 RepID=A0A964T110_9HYPH|nr:CoA transferase [Propylenella binzhouense]MYZ46408.1 CoA transferase [Propylenella binzhouense]
MTGPLAGIKIVEIASIVLGPLAGQYLGDMGADVIKVEAPEGDVTRVQGPRRSDKMSALFLSCNRNKRSVVLDLRQPEGHAALVKLLQGADVFIHSIRTRAAQNSQLDYDSVRKINENIVYCHVKGFSDEGAYAGKPAYDDIIQGLSGLAALQSAIGGEPRYIPAIIADKLTGVHAAYAVALALYHKLATGRGQRVDVPMFETMASFNVIEHLWGGSFEPFEGGFGYPTIANATRRPFRTKDGYLAFLPHTDAHWERFLTAIGRNDLLTDRRFATFRGRQENADVIWSMVKEELVGRTSKEWLDLLGGLDVPIGFVNSIKDLVDDPHLNSVNFWSLHQHPTEGMLRMAGLPLTLSDSPASIRRLPPRLGEHTEEVLREHDCSPDMIRAVMSRVPQEM